MRALRAHGSLYPSDLSFPLFRTENLQAVARMHAAALGVDTATGDSVMVAALYALHAVGRD